MRISKLHLEQASARELAVVPIVDVFDIYSCRKNFGVFSADGMRSKVSHVPRIVPLQLECVSIPMEFPKIEDLARRDGKIIFRRGRNALMRIEGLYEKHIPAGLQRAPIEIYVGGGYIGGSEGMAEVVRCRISLTRNWPKSPVVLDVIKANGEGEPKGLLFGRCRENQH